MQEVAIEDDVSVGLAVEVVSNVDLADVGCAVVFGKDVVVSGFPSTNLMTYSVMLLMLSIPILLLAFSSYNCVTSSAGRVFETTIVRVVRLHSFITLMNISLSLSSS